MKQALLECDFYRETGSRFRMLNLLGESKKTLKGNKYGYLTKVLYMLPSTYAAEFLQGENAQKIVAAVADKFGISRKELSSMIEAHNACLFADKCREDCLAKTSGHLAMTDSQHYMFAKTCLWLANPQWFADQVQVEVGRLEMQAIRKTKKDGMRWRTAVRLNGGTDVAWEDTVMRSVIEEYPSTAWYDYTKIEQRMMRYMTGQSWPRPYTLTFSAGSSNDLAVDRVRKAGGNVAVVVRDRVSGWDNRGDLTDTHPGDDDDLRFLDPPSVWVLLKPMGSARKSTSRFIRKDLREQMVRSMAASRRRFKNRVLGAPAYHYQTD